MLSCIELRKLRSVKKSTKAELSESDEVISSKLRRED
jgi:hypothetical protein